MNTQNKDFYHMLCYTATLNTTYCVLPIESFFLNSIRRTTTKRLYTLTGVRASATNVTTSQPGSRQDVEPRDQPSTCLVYRDPFHASLSRNMFTQ